MRWRDFGPVPAPSNLPGAAPSAGRAVVGARSRSVLTERAMPAKRHSSRRDDRAFHAPAMSTPTPGPKRDPNRNAPPDRPQPTEPARQDRANGTSQDGRAMSSVGSHRHQDGWPYPTSPISPEHDSFQPDEPPRPGPVPIRSIWAGSTAHCTTSKSVAPSIQPSSCLANV